MLESSFQDPNGESNGNYDGFSVIKNIIGIFGIYFGFLIGYGFF